MLQGYAVITKLKEQLLGVMEKHGFETLDDMRGKALDAFTTHANLVELQRAAKAAQVGNSKDAETWQGNIKDETDSLTSN